MSNYKLHLLSEYIPAQRIKTWEELEQGFDDICERAGELFGMPVMKLPKSEIRLVSRGETVVLKIGNEDD